MQSAATVLGVLRERGRRGLPCEELYRQMFNPQLYLLAYGRIYANKGAMTPGATQETVDGMSMRKIDRIIEAMRHERYRFRPVRRVHIPKKNGKTRPLGMPTWSDKLAGEVVRLLLEAYYEPVFSGRSHGFRPGRSCHTALREVANTWTGTTWFVEGDIADCFGAFDHDVMAGVLSEKIHDNRFLRLLRNMLTAGYLEDWRWGVTLSGVPQGGIASPVLSNIYLHKLDVFVETVLIPEYTRGRLRASNPEYRKVEHAIARARRKGDRAEVRSLYRRLHSLPSQDPRDPGYRRLRYCRYADDTLLGFAGPKAEAEEIKHRLAAFLREDLKLELSPGKTLITHARTQRARFLGYEISVASRDHRTRRPSATDKRNRRSLNGTVVLHVPASVVKAKSALYLSRGKPACRNPMVNETDYNIVARFGAEYRGIVQYYLLAGLPCSRPWPASTARRCQRWQPATRLKSRHRTGCAPASRPAWRREAERKRTSPGWHLAAQPTLLAPSGGTSSTWRARSPRWRKLRQRWTSTWPSTTPTGRTRRWMRRCPSPRPSGSPRAHRAAGVGQPVAASQPRKRKPYRSGAW
jgi:group II intron reverse transcriptase/maturase